MRRRGFFQRPDRREFLAGDVLGDCAGGEHVDVGRLGGALVNVRDGAGGVGGGRGVRHADDGGESAAGGAAGAGLDGFLRAATGFAQVHVDVDQPRRDEAVGGVDDLGVGGALIGEFAVGDADIPDRVGPSGGIEHAAVLDEEIFHAPPPQRKSTAMRTAMPLVTCWRITDCSQSASSLSISTPRLIGRDA